MRKNDTEMAQNSRFMRKACEQGSQAFLIETGKCSPLRQFGDHFGGHSGKSQPIGVLLLASRQPPCSPLLRALWVPPGNCHEPKRLWNAPFPATKWRLADIDYALTIRLGRVSKSSGRPGVRPCD